MNNDFKKANMLAKIIRENHSAGHLSRHAKTAILTAMTEYSDLIQAENVQIIRALETELEKWKLDSVEQYRQGQLADEKCERYKIANDSYYEESVIYKETNTKSQSRIVELQELIKLHENYIELLGKELLDAGSIAKIAGWKLKHEVEMTEIVSKISALTNKPK